MFKKKETDTKEIDKAKTHETKECTNIGHKYEQNTFIFKGTIDNLCFYTV